MCKMQLKSLVIPLLVIAIWWTYSATADMLELMDGTLVTGKFMGGTENDVNFKVGQELQSYPRADVLSITFLDYMPELVPTEKATPTAAKAPTS